MNLLSPVFYFVGREATVSSKFQVCVVVFVLFPSFY